MQRGSVIQLTRKDGVDVWQFRWSDKDLNGRRVYHRRVIGTVDQYAGRGRRTSCNVALDF